MTFTFQRVFHLFWFVDANCPSSDTKLEVHEFEPSLLSSWIGNFFQRHILDFFQRHILEEDNAETDFEEIGWEGKDPTCPKTGTSD
jgi:hypothetical protein